MWKSHTKEAQVDGATFHRGCADNPAEQQDLVVLLVEHRAMLLKDGCGAADAVSNPWSELDL
jgi:hypothetical protein